MASGIAEVTRRALVLAVTANFVAKRRLPLNESIDMTIEQRVYAGDTEAVHDLARDTIAQLEILADRAAALLCDEPEAIRRLSELRRRQQETGRQSRRPLTQETVPTDRHGTEPRGSRHEQDRPRRARAGKAAQKRSRRC